jgi:hypothetical protein
MLHLETKYCGEPFYCRPGDILRETQLSGFRKLLQILYGYLKPIAFLNLVSN